MRVDAPQPDCELVGAVLIWKSSRQHFVTVNEVAASQSPPLVMGGRVAQTRDIETLLKAVLGSSAPDSAAFLPAHVLSVGSRLTWWRKSAPAHMWFRGDGLGTRDGVAAQPSLVFQVGEGCGLRVWAVKGTARPGPSTRLYQAPYPNIWEAGGVCTGNTVLPQSYDQTSTQAWESCFFNSNFTHSNLRGRGRLTTWTGGVYELWRALLDQSQALDSKGQRFPNSALSALATPLRLGDIL
jgi:PRTRC genetic system protein B